MKYIKYKAIKGERLPIGTPVKYNLGFKNLHIGTVMNYISDEIVVIKLTTPKNTDPMFLRIRGLEYIGATNE